MINLSSLVQHNYLESILISIQQSKKEKGNVWWYQNKSIAHACRDAILWKKSQIVQLFLDEGLPATIDTEESESSRERHPLLWFAAKVNNLPAVELLVSRGALICDNAEYSKQEDHQDVMRIAIENGYSEIVHYLLEHGGSSEGIFSPGENQTFLGKAAANNDPKIAELLVHYGASIPRALQGNQGEFRQMVSDSNVSQRYSNTVKILLDLAPGTNFPKEELLMSRFYYGLTFLKNLDISGFNFVGISLDGFPITREMLIERGYQGAENALVSMSDIDHLEDQERQKTLHTRLNANFQTFGKIIDIKGIVNLVSLVDAAENGQLDVVKMRLSAGMDPNQVKTEILRSYTAIEIAASKGFLEVVELLAKPPLINHKSLINASSKAKQNGHDKIVHFLSSFIDINEKDRWGNAPIHKAIEKGDIEEVSKLFEQGADIHLQNDMYLSPLQLACSSINPQDKTSYLKRIQIVEFLLNKGANPNIFNWKSPLQFAVESGSAKAVALLLPVTEKKDHKTVQTFGTLIESETIIPWYEPLLFGATPTAEWMQIITQLLEHGADINRIHSEKGVTILFEFMRRFPSGHGLAKAQMAQRANILGCETFHWEKVLQKDHRERIERFSKQVDTRLNILESLLNLGADPCIPCGEGKQTALHAFIHEIDLSHKPGATENVITHLLLHKMDIHTPDGNGMTPLHTAAQVGNIPAIHFLIRNQANVNARNNKGKTPLHFAAAGKPNLVTYLINEGAEPNAQDVNGLTPICYSQQMAEKELKRYLHPSEEMVKPFLQAQEILRQVGGK